MISSFIQGGLGNQMFQIAAGASLAKDLNTEFALHEGQHFLPLQGYRIETYKSNIFKNINFKYLSSNNFKFIYRYEDTQYRQIPQQDNLMLVGYFQSEKYFKQNKNYILSLFDIEYKSVPEGSVSLHIRRGDYLKNPGVHPTLASDYYHRALEIIGDYSNVYVFTDSDLPENLNIKNMQIVKFDKDYDELSFMASCDNNIIANSTFSWWAAYLNRNENKKVIAPKTWFGPQGPQYWQDIYCDKWEII